MKSDVSPPQSGSTTAAQPSIGSVELQNGTLAVTTAEATQTGLSATMTVPDRSSWHVGGSCLRELSMRILSKRLSSCCPIPPAGTNDRGMPSPAVAAVGHHLTVVWFSRAMTEK